MRRCAICRSEEGLVETGQVALCPRCSTELGERLLAQPERFHDLWPALREDDDDPEPRVRLDDGTSIELRERTAELKRDLTVEERAELAYTFVALGLARESLLEAAFVLSAGPSPALRHRALALLFPEAPAPSLLAELRSALYPS